MLTDKAVSQAKPKEKLYRISDNAKNGLCLEVAPEGGKRWRFRYRFNGKPKMISLGVYPLVTLKEARDKAFEAKKDVEKGINPGEKEKAGTNAGIFSAVAKEWFDRFSATTTERYAAETWARLEREVLPYISDKKLVEIDAPTILEILRRIESRNAIVTMYKVKSHISQILRYGIACGLIYSDPSRDLTRALQSKKSTPRAAIIDPRQVGKLMLAIDSYPHCITRCALLLAALTFVRPGELRRAVWSEIDVDAAEWRIPAERMKMKRPHIVPLARQSVHVLEELLTYRSSGEYLFPSTRTLQRPMSDATVNAALRYLGYGREEMSGHGFRAMASSLLSERGWSVDAIERQLAHVEGNKIRAAYHRSEHLDERRRMMQDWADYLHSLRQKV